MTTRSTLSTRSFAAVAFAFALGVVTSVQAVTALSEPGNTITIYKPLGFAFGFTGSTPSSLFGTFGGGGGGGGGFAGGGTMPQLNLGPKGNFLAGPGGGVGGGGFVAGPTPVFQGGAAVVGGGEQTPQSLGGVNNLVVAQVPDAGVGTLGFGLVLAVLGLAARFLNRPLRSTAGEQTK